MPFQLDYKARTNPVFMTAKTAVCLMAKAGIPDADSIVDRMGPMPGMTDPEVILGNALVVEAKYRTMCRLIQESGYMTNVDLPCGYTPKALHITERGLRFVGLDLPIVAEEIGPILLSLAAHPERIQFHGVDATNYGSLVAALKEVEGPLCVSTEGMMMYFTESEASAVVENIAGLLKTHGGCWITPDPEFIIQFFLTFRSVLGEGALQKLMASRDAATSQSDVGNLTNSLIMSPEDPHDSLNTAMAFLRRHGLKAERVDLAEYMPELTAYRMLSEAQITAFKEAMRRCHYWIITLDDSVTQRREPREEAIPFGMDCSVLGSTFRASLSGRMDTITAPELLKAWETEKAAHTINGAEIDCSELQYISSAGLRVLLIIQKALPAKPIRLTGVNEVVREILETTGFVDVFSVSNSSD